MSGSKLKLMRFIKHQLKEMCENIESNFDKNMDARKGNPFLIIDSKINKCMGLGRSTDSQLGNRMQNIVFYSARLRYGEKAVPNLVLIETDREKKTVKCTCFYVELSCYDNLLLNGKSIKQRAFKQIVLINKKVSIDDIAKSIGLAKNDKSNIKIYEEIFTEVDDESLEYLKKREQDKKRTEIDLLLFGVKLIRTFEIKLGGSLDTKNAPANIREIADLKELFAFSSVNHTYFATCYGNGSEAVAKNFKSDKRPFDKNDGILKNTEFGKVVLPEDISYDEFIKMYQTAFKNAGINETLKRLSQIK